MHPRWKPWGTVFMVAGALYMVTAGALWLIDPLVPPAAWFPLFCFFWGLSGVLFGYGIRQATQAPETTRRKP